MKLLYCITRSTWGGAQENVWELMKYEVEKNEVILVVGEEGRLTERVRNELPEVKLIVLNQLQRSINIRKDFSAVRSFRRLVKKVKPDIVHLHSSKAGVIGRMACIGLGCKVMFTVHGWAFTDGVVSRRKKALYRGVERYMASLTDKLVLVSNYDYKIGIRDKVIKDPKIATVVYNGVDNPKFERNYVNENLLNVVMTARFSNQKDQESLIWALSRLRDKNIHVTFVGDGPNLLSMKELAKKLKLENRISFVGFKKNVENFLKEADLFVLSTHYEGLPISIIEAMSYKLPIIATDVGGNSELVTDGDNGFLVHNRDEMTKYLKYYKEKPAALKMMGENSYKKFLDKFTLNKFLTETDSIYNTLKK